MTADAGLQVSQPAGEVVKPNSWKCIMDEGMPVHGRPYEKGNLYVHFNVKFPTTLTRQQVAAIQQVLPSAPRDSSENGTMDVDSENVRPHPLLAPSHCFVCLNPLVNHGF